MDLVIYGTGFLKKMIVMKVEMIPIKVMNVKKKIPVGERYRLTGRIVFVVGNKVEDVIKERNESTMEQSLEIIRRRIDESGAVEPVIQRQGKKRILVLLPRFKDPYDHKDYMRVKSLLGQIAKLTFHLVDEDNDDDLKNYLLKDNQIILPDKDDENRKYLLQKTPSLDGYNLIDAQPSFDQNDPPAVKFSFDRIGAIKFGKITSANIGERFAIVLDGVVISAPIIQSAILEGKGKFQVILLLVKPQILLY